MKWLLRETYNDLRESEPSFLSQSTGKNSSAFSLLNNIKHLDSHIIFTTNVRSSVLYVNCGV
ncbi:hypothetical protein GCM10011384_33500 [Psychrobacillus lasiicapitis]|nr:hypothetical protein GCM10011384_33500 [Psychrobacillus lasiicapitis]